MADIKETKELVAFGFTVAVGVKEITADGKLTLGDAGSLLRMLAAAPKGVAGIENVPGEISDLSDEERTELMQYAVEELNRLGYSAENVDEIVDSILRMAQALVIGINALTKKD